MFSLYKEAANIIQSADNQKGSVKTLVLGSLFKNKKALYAIVCQTLKNRDILDEIATKCQIRKHEKCLSDKNICLTVLYDFLFGRGLVKGKFKDAINRHKTSLKAELSRIKIRKHVSSNKQLLRLNESNVCLPRYVRVNTLRSNVDLVMEYFKRDGYKLFSLDENNYDSFKKSVKKLKGKQFILDFHIPNLLVFPSNSDFHDNSLYITGDIILQEKASCLPAMILNPLPGSHCIDCCAAPGNKTSQLAAIMKNRGNIYAFDKDPKRFSTMSSQLLKTSAICVRTEMTDFLKIDINNDIYKNVEYILCDPSCSGSGILNRLNEQTNNENSNSKDRLNNLAIFQKNILSHALSFPNVKHVVYSTCSINKEENEDVLEFVLEKFSDKFKLQPIKLSGFEENNGFICLNQNEHLTNGFFVAHIKRIC